MTTTARDRSRRYDAIARVYDIVSLERLLYRQPRERLLQLLAPAEGATVLDLGCGTGLNFPGVLRALGPGGRLIGLDPSRGMLARAHRRVTEAGWPNVRLLHGDAAQLHQLLDRAGINSTSIDTVLATFVLSVLDDDRPVWDVLDGLAAATHPLRLGIADIGPATTAAPPARAVYRMLAALGDADPHRHPWNTLGQRCALTAHEVYRGGHVHVATAMYGNRRTPT